jgi:asparagine synthase (glutamine-hydrolysing)
MCGIAGWIDLKSDLSQQNQIIGVMADSLSPRGPDASGFWLSNHAALGHRRLVVVDPAGGGQPMIRKYAGHTYVLIYNGELYNTLDIRRDLEARGHIFQSNSDTEVLLVSFIEWKEKCLDHLNGIFAFAIWDEEDRRLFLARDRFGVKPLFYTLQSSSFIFASELKAILAHPIVKHEIDAGGLAEIFSLGPSRTPGNGVFKNVYEVKPANYINYDNYGLQIKKYWALESHPHPDNLENTILKVRELVQDTIIRQLVSDVPVCTFLSGGLDSSAITALAAEYFRKTYNSQLHTYSIDYFDNDLYFKASDFQPNTDAPWVKRMSDEFGTLHHNIIIDTPQLVNALKDATYARDLPGMADIDSSLWLFCHEIKKSHVVALSGECADEVFGGYPWFHRDDLFNSKTFPWLRSANERTKVLSPEIKQLIKPEEYITARYLETLREVPILQGEDPVEARRREIFYLNIYWFMSTLLDRKDRMSMAQGLEVRVPFCDHRLVQYVWNIPWDMKFCGGIGKGVLRQALKGILPDDVLMRKKSPYPKTHNPCYEKTVREWLFEILHDSSSPLLQLIDLKTIIELAEGKSNYGKPWFGQLMATPQLLAYLIQVDLWLRHYKVSIV